MEFRKLYVTVAKTIPILDIYGDADGIRHPVDKKMAEDDVVLAEKRKLFASPKYKQARIPSAGHVFYSSAKQEELADAISKWIAEVENASAN